MKKYLLFVILMSFIVVPLFSQIRSNRDLVGKWQGSDMQVEFLSNSKVIMIVPGGKLPVASYTTDFTTIPISLTITLADNGQKMVYRGTMEFIDNQTIKFEYFGSEQKNDPFEKGRTVTLKKAK